MVRVLCQVINPVKLLVLILHCYHTKYETRAIVVFKNVWYSVALLPLSGSEMIFWGSRPMDYFPFSHLPAISTNSKVHTKACVLFIVNYQASLQ